MQESPLSSRSWRGGSLLEGVVEEREEKGFASAKGRGCRTGSRKENLCRKNWARPLPR